MQTRIEIHLVNTGKTDRKDVLELIHSALIKNGIAEHPKINYGLTAVDHRKYVSFTLDDKVLAFLNQHGTTTTISIAKSDSDNNPIPHQ